MHDLVVSKISHLCTDLDDAAVEIEEDHADHCVKVT